MLPIAISEAELSFWAVWGNYDRLQAAWVAGEHKAYTYNVLNKSVVLRLPTCHVGQYIIITAIIQQWMHSKV